MNSLPPFVGPFLGRDAALAALAEHWEARTPLVTVVGPAGVGKTRLVAEAATHLQERPDGPQRLVWVDLLEQRHPPALLAALIHSLQADTQGLDDLQAVGARLMLTLEPETLLIFDNGEGLSDASRRLLDAWLAARRPDTRWWMTSQEPLGLAAEHTDTLAPLPLPAPDASLDAARQTPAVALIEALVRWRRGRFDPTRDEVEGLVQLAHELDGLPLALTMAAGRMTLLDAGHVLERIEHNLAFLKTPLGSHAAHHSTLNRALEYAVARLTPEELRVWCLCACFSGGFTVEALEHLAQEVALDALEVLEHRFLIQRLTPHGAPRLALLDTLRRYALRELSLAGELDDARDRHAAWCAQHAASHLLRVATEPQALQPILTERLNLEAALGHLRETLDARPGDPTQTTQALQIATALHVAQREANTFILPEDHLEQALAWARRCEQPLPPLWMAHLLHHMAIERKARPTEAFMPLSDEALELARRAGDATLTGDILRRRADHHIARCEDEAAQEALRQAFNVLTHPILRAQAQMSLAVLMMNTTDEARLRQVPPLLDEVIAACEEHHDPLTLAKAHLNQSLTCRMLGDTQRTSHHIERSVAIFTSLGHLWGTARSSIQRLDFMAQLGQCHLPADALRELVEETRRLVALAEDPQLTALMETNIAQIHLERGDYTTAIALLRDQLPLMEGWDQRDVVRTALTLIIAETLQLTQGSSVNPTPDDWERLWADLRDSPLEWQRCQAWLWLTLLHSVSLDRPRAEEAYAQLQGVIDDPSYLRFARGALALGRARALDPLCLDPACAALLEETLDGLRAFTHPDTVWAFDQDIRLMFRCLSPVLPAPVRAQIWSEVLDPHGLHMIVYRDGLGFRVPGGAWVELRHRPTLALLLQTLLEGGDEGVSAHTLVDTLYPDEALVHEAGLNRVYKQLSLLRRKGLKAMIERHNGQYRLSPDVHVILVPPLHGEHTDVPPWSPPRTR
ncbi:MAG: hypothetical protein CMH57_14045 [Myxococcales bacterium]|nr:hypothetical protein [Myxococcales bacterium]